MSCKSLLCFRKIGLDLVQLGFVVECHQVHILLGGELNERCLFARIGVNDSRRCNFYIKNSLYFILISNNISGVARKFSGWGGGKSRGSSPPIPFPSPHFPFHSPPSP